MELLRLPLNRSGVHYLFRLARRWEAGGTV
jgi:hypothetical protein